MRPRPLGGLAPADVSDRSLSKADANHRLLADLAEKSELFDKAATKYSAKVAS